MKRSTRPSINPPTINWSLGGRPLDGGGFREKGSLGGVKSGRPFGGCGWWYNWGGSLDLGSFGGLTGDEGSLGGSLNGLFEEGGGSMATAAASLRHCQYSCGRSCEKEREWREREWNEASAV